MAAPPQNALFKKPPPLFIEPAAAPDDALTGSEAHAPDGSLFEFELDEPPEKGIRSEGIGHDRCLIAS